MGLEERDLGLVAGGVRRRQLEDLEAEPTQDGLLVAVGAVVDIGRDLLDPGVDADTEDRATLLSDGVETVEKRGGRHDGKY